MKKNEKVKKKADMYCYDCKNVFCDHHSGVRDNRKIHGRLLVKRTGMSEQMYAMTLKRTVELQHIKLLHGHFNEIFKKFIHFFVCLYEHKFLSILHMSK